MRETDPLRTQEKTPGEAGQSSTQWLPDCPSAGCEPAKVPPDEGRIPLAIYVHIPFCVKKCAYCDFLSFPQASFGGQASEMQGRYFDALVSEILAVVDSASGYEVKSVYFGGGTPSCVEARHISRILERIHARFSVAGDAEVSLECNPGTADREKLRTYRGAGVNRLSIGVQSFDDSMLKLLGRIHTAKEALRCAEDARAARFDNVSLDLMAALPGQTQPMLLDSVRRAISLSPEHLSLYSLIIEEGTPFYERFADQVPDPHYDRTSCAASGAIGTKPRLPGEEEERAMLHAAWELLDTAGYERYEISNFAKRSGNRCFRCVQNMTYWTRGDYLGLGLGAASLIRETRFSNTRELARYLEAFQETGGGRAGADAGAKPVPGPADHRLSAVRENVEKLSACAQMEEFMFLGLRLTSGVSAERFERAFHRKLDEVYGDVIGRLVRDGLLMRRKESVMLTGRGTDLANYVMAEFLLPRDENSAMISDGSL